MFDADDVQRQLHADRLAFEKKFSKFKRKIKKHKKRLPAHQFEWKQECEHLKRRRARVWSALEQCINSLEAQAKVFAVKPSTHIKGMVEQRQKQVKGGSGLRKKNAISSKTKYTGLKAHINKLNKQTNDANIYEIKPDDSEGDTADGSNGSDLDTVRARAGTDREVSVAMRGAHDAEKEENGDDDRQKDAGETKKMKEREIGLMILDLSPCIEEKEKAYLSFRHQLSTIVHHTKHSIKEYRQRCQQRIQQHEQSLHRDLNPAMNGGFQRKTRNKKRGTHRAVHFEAEAVYNDIDSINDDFSIDHNRHFGQHQHHNIVPQQCHDQHDSRDQSPFHTGQPLGRKSSADDAYGNHHDDGHPQDKYNDGGNPGEGNYSNNHEFLIPLDEEGNPVQTHGGCRTDTDAWDHDRFPSVEMCSDVNSGDSSSSVLGSRNGHDSGTGTGASGGGDGDGYEGHDGDSSEALADLQTTQHILKSNRKTMDQVGEDLEQQLQTIQRELRGVTLAWVTKLSKSDGREDLYNIQHQQHPTQNSGGREEEDWLRDGTKSSGARASNSDMRGGRENELGSQARAGDDVNVNSSAFRAHSVLSAIDSNATPSRATRRQAGTHACSASKNRQTRESTRSDLSSDEDGAVRVSTKHDYSAVAVALSDISMKRDFRKSRLSKTPCLPPSLPSSTRARTRRLRASLVPSSSSSSSSSSSRPSSRASARSSSSSRPSSRAGKMRGKTKKLAMSRSNVNSREKENESGRILSGRGSRGRERGRGRQGKGVGGRRKSLPCLPSLHTSVKQNTTGTIDKINHLNRIATTTRGGLSIASDGNPPSSLLRSSRAVTCRSKPSAPPLPRSSSRLSDTADSGRPRSNSFTEESGKTTLHQSDQNIESSHENGESGASDVKESSCTDASGSEALEQQTALIHEQVAVMVSENAASAAHRIFAFEQEFHERQQHLGLQLQALERKHTAKLRKKKERQLARQENAGTRGSRGPGSAGPDAEEEESESCAAASSADTDDLHNSISTSASSTDARRFQKICSEYARRGKSLGMLMDRLKLEFPHKSSKELEMRYDIHRDRRFLLDMKQLMHRQTSQEERLIRMQGQGLIDQLIEQQLRARAKECQYAKDDRKRLDAHEQLRKWRSKCKKQQAAQRALEKEREAKDKEHRRRLNKQESIWRKRDKHKLAAYNGERERQEMQRKREERETEEEEEALRQEQLKKGKVRVDFRKDLYSIKQMQILQKDLQLQQSEEERKQRLDSLRGSVRATIQNHFVSNPDRVWQHTRSSAQGRRHVNHALGAGGSGVREGDGGEGQGCSAAVLGGEVRRKMFDVHGYTNDQLNKDVRFRLVQKLERAGLHNTDYGRKVLCKAFTNHTAVGNPAANSRNKHTDF